MPKADCFGCGSLPERPIRVLLTSFRSSTLPSNTSLQDSSVATHTRQRLIILLGESEGFRASGGPERFDRIDVAKSSYHHLSQNATDSLRFGNVRSYLKDECRNGTLRTLPSKRGGKFHRASHPNMDSDPSGRPRRERTRET